MTEYLFYGGPILTMEDPAHTPEALTVRDGNILAVGSFCDLRSQIPRPFCPLSSTATAILSNMRVPCAMPT